jgi:acetylornithine deacetylase/succinyl-diaminopimelate desuccinylase-like protein
VGSGVDALIYSGHFDTVPPNLGQWTHGPHRPVVEDDKVFGLGASDMHASTVCAYFASLFLREVELPGRVITAFTIEEETTGDGTQIFLDRAEADGSLDFSRTSCVVTEPTGLDHFCLGNRGSSFVVIEVTGLGGHGSRPHLAHNPAVRAVEILGGIRELEARWREEHHDPEFGHPTLTVTAINSGDLERTNVIPSVAELVLDCRLTPALWADDLAPFREQLGSLLTSFADDHHRIEWRELYPREGHKLAADHPLVDTVTRALREDLGLEAEARYTPAGNDAVYFGMRGIPTINKVGPGLPECCHRVDEFVPVKNLLLGVELYIWIALRHFRR